MRRRRNATDGVVVRVNPFARRHEPSAPFSHYDGTWEQLARLTARGLNQGSTRPGYRPEVKLVVVPPAGFYTSVVQLHPGARLEGSYTARREGEEPRKSVYAKGGRKMPARSVEIVVYHASILGSDATGASGWEIISINASPWDGPMPIAPETLLANHFGLSGGTPTGMSPAAFEEALRESVLFWKDKAQLG